MCTYTSYIHIHTDRDREGRLMSKQRIDISADIDLLNLMKDRGVTNRSAFMCNATKTALLSDKKVTAYMMAARIKECFDEGGRLLSEFEKQFHTRDYQGVVEEWGVQIKSDEEKALSNLYNVLTKAYSGEMLKDPRKKPFILAWLETRAPGFGLNYPAEVVFDKLMANGFGEAKA
jgi:hypothetical protein